MLTPANQNIVGDLLLHKKTCKSVKIVPNFDFSDVAEKRCITSVIECLSNNRYIYCASSFQIPWNVTFDPILSWCRRSCLLAVYSINVCQESLKSLRSLLWVVFSSVTKFVPRRFFLGGAVKKIYRSHLYIHRHNFSPGNRFRPGFEVVSPCPFPKTITITPRASPQ